MVDIADGKRLLQNVDDDEPRDVVSSVFLSPRCAEDALLHVIVHHRRRDDLLVGQVKRPEGALEQLDELIHVQIDRGDLVVAGKVERGDSRGEFARIR